MDVGEWAFLAGAGVVSGVASSAGAIGTLISYPALLATGLGPLAANVTNSVAVVATGAGATLGSRPELRGRGRQVLRWSTLLVAGAFAGAALLLGTPGGLFEWLVPFLVAGAAAVLLVQPRIVGRRAARGGEQHRALLPAGLLAVGVYDGYFGAASGIMTLAVLLLSAEPDLVRANALKNALLGVADIGVAALFVLFGPVHWMPALALALGLLAGGLLGPAIARRLPAHALRVVIALAGFGLAVYLLGTAVHS